MITRLVTILFLLTTFIAEGQIRTDVIKKILTESLGQLPYRDFSSSYQLKYSSGLNQHLFIAHRLRLDSTVLEKLNLELNDYLEKEKDHQDYSGMIRFDNYTEKFFISISDSRNPVFTAVESGPTPAGGMGHFMERWIHYIDSLATKSKFDYSAVTVPEYVHFDVGLDGGLKSSDESRFSSLLKDFIEQEKKWRMGLSSSRPQMQRVVLELPSSNPSEKTADYWIHTQLRESSTAKPIYYASSLPHHRTSVIVSAIFDHGKYTMPVVHQGTTEDTGKIIDFLTRETNKPKISGKSDFRRIYFYTLD